MRYTSSIGSISAETPEKAIVMTLDTHQLEQTNLVNSWRSQGVEIRELTLYVVRRHNRFLVALPPGTLTKRARASESDEISALEAAVDTISRRSLKISPRIRPIVRRDGALRLYLRHELVEALSKADPFNPMLATLSTLQALVESNWRMFFPPTAKANHDLSYDQRKEKYGRAIRGPHWTPAEDALLSEFFGPDPATGKRQKMDDVRWRHLLARLKDRRTRRSVLARISALNAELKKSLMVDGFLDDKGVQLYKKRKLGTRTRVPNYRPRLKGTYHQAKPSSDGTP